MHSCECRIPSVVRGVSIQGEGGTALLATFGEMRGGLISGDGFSGAGLYMHL